MRYDVNFTPNSKIITFPLNAMAVFVCLLGCLIGLWEIYIGYEWDATFLLVGGGLTTLVCGLVVYAMLTRHRKIVLTKDHITLEQSGIHSKPAKVVVPVHEINAVFKERHVIKGKYGTRSDAYDLVINYREDQEVQLLRMSQDVKKVDEVKKIITNYTGAPTRLTREPQR